MSNGNAERNTLRGAPRWVHGFAWGVTGAFTFLLVVLYLIYRDTDVWLILSDTPLRKEHAFNEAVYGGIYRQRSNTLSNLAYVLVGLYVIAYAWWDYRRPTKETDPYAVRHPALMGLFGLTCIELGIGSGLMHAAMTPWGHKLDVLGMIATVSALFALHWARWIPSIAVGVRRWPTWPVAGFLAVTVSIFLARNMKMFGVAGNTAYAGLIGVVGTSMALEHFFGRTSRQYRWAVLSFVSLALAFYIWNLDRAGQFSSPESWFQGHAIWHLLTAVTLGSAAIFYRSEVPINPDSAGPDLR
ncbi:MAG TPA: ceramidase domain-containing protein [Candidatus Hydrogenedentes bacterium]|nr:ceramidase domain-containing protein [Candidatus Hydrogenedentota bacterium]